MEDGIVMSKIEDLITENFGKSHPISVLGKLVQEETPSIIEKIDKYISIVHDNKKFNNNEKMERIFRAISLKELITGKSKESIELLNYLSDLPKKGISWKLIYNNYFN
jgi:hypothetical protein